MGKFFKKIKEQLEATKTATKFMAMGGTQLTLQKFYDIYFKALNAFAFGSPTSQDVWAWKTYIIKVIDKKYNNESREKAKQVLTNFKLNKKVLEEDKVWIKTELIPYFEDSYKRQLKKVEVIVNDIDLLKVKGEVNTAKKYTELK